MGLENYRGALLGLAVGDAMGYTVDSRSWAEIQEDYGPHGLMGYDLANGYAEISSYTQLAAFTCNGLLFGLTRGQMTGQMAPFIKYVALSSLEWAGSQRRWEKMPRTYCWLYRQPELCRRHCMDTRMLDTLENRHLGSLEEPQNYFYGPESLTTAVGVGLFYHPDRMKRKECDFLGAEAVALTHGNPSAFLAGFALSHIVGRLIRKPDLPLKTVVKEACDHVKDEFGHQYSQAFELCNLLKMAVSLSENPYQNPVEVMEKLQCCSGSQVLAGAIYACLVSDKDFDTAMIIAVNHSGRSAAVGAVAGAILGLRLGDQALPSFYLECLEPAEILQELAYDLHGGCPMEMGNKLFDLDWDRKYLHGGR